MNPQRSQCLLSPKEEFGRGQWCYSCQWEMFMALEVVRHQYWLKIFHQNAFSQGKITLWFSKGRESLSSVYSERAGCEKDVCVPVHPAASQYLDSNLGCKSCTLKYSSLPAADQTLITHSSIFWTVVLVNGSYAVSCWIRTVVPLAFLVQRSPFFTKWRIRKKKSKTEKSVTGY